MLTETSKRDPTEDGDWVDLSAHWRIRPDTTYLNHGSFGLPPNEVRYARRGFINRLDENPMDFFVRQMEGLLLNARNDLASFVGTGRENLVFVENATYAMNVVAKSFALSPGDEILIGDHEYGAVQRIWDRRCSETGAQKSLVKLPNRIESEQQIVDALLAATNDKTRMLVISHITSPTAMILPIQRICTAFSDRGVAICVDGPHAPVQVELKIDELGCDFYTASCHKWLCATLGSGFVYAHPRWHSGMEPVMKSWGRLLPAIPVTWDEEYTWMGTRDPSTYLSIPVAIEFLSKIGLSNFRARSRFLAGYAESALCELFGTHTIASRELGWYGSMAHVPLPPGDWLHLQKRLWEQVGIEVPIILFDNRWFVRVSCHLYNNRTQIDTLVKALHRICK